MLFQALRRFTTLTINFPPTKILSPTGHSSETVSICARTSFSLGSIRTTPSPACKTINPLSSLVMMTPFSAPVLGSHSLFGFPSIRIKHPVNLTLAPADTVPEPSSFTLRNSAPLHSISTFFVPILVVSIPCRSLVSFNSSSSLSPTDTFKDAASTRVPSGFSIVHLRWVQPPPRWRRARSGQGQDA